MNIFPEITKVILDSNTYFNLFVDKVACYTKLYMCSVGDVENAGKVKDLIMTKVGILLLK